MSYYRRRKRTRTAPKARFKKEKCLTKWCRNRRALRTDTEVKADGTTTRYTITLKHCWKCKSRLFKARHPHAYVLNVLRVHARKRKIPCTLTLKEFKEFCDLTGYLDKRGQEPGSMTIDRKDASQGYHAWNIQPLSHAENSAQGGNNVPRETVDDNNEPF